MKMVKQRDSTGCGVAAVAMLYGVSYKKAKKIIKKEGGFCGREFMTDNQGMKKVLRRLRLIRKTAKFIHLRSLKNLKGKALIGAYQKANGDWHWIVGSVDRNGPYVLNPNRCEPHRRIRKALYRIPVKSVLYLKK